MIIHRERLIFPENEKKKVVFEKKEDMVVPITPTDDQCA
jgi:hypothetical protein